METWMKPGEEAEAGEEYTLLVKHETDKAVLVNDGDEDIWLPKSKIDYDEIEAGEECNFLIPEWLAVDKGLE